MNEIEKEKTLFKNKKEKGEKN
jgi:hypothetical protein